MLIKLKINLEKLELECDDELVSINDLVINDNVLNLEISRPDTDDANPYSGVIY